ncbi:MAG: cytochrome c oxidase assembly factor 1 family protein [Planctomycetaceae bacterium]|nr:cytochrome c oxidase assembly factor 1 family protein [Planctomycetaceae bacterium]
MIVLIVLGVLLLLCAGICGGCALFFNRAATEVNAAIELRPIQEAALAAVRSDPQVKDKLGEPLPEFVLHIRDGSGEVKSAGENFHFDLDGPKGSAKVLCSATKEAGTWRLTAITVQTSEGATFTVPPPAATGPDVRFDMPDVPEETK